MADLTILDRLRFVALQQNNKKRNASNLVSLSQDSCSSTQPVKPPSSVITHSSLRRHTSDATTAATSTRAARKLNIVNHATISLDSSPSHTAQATQTEESYKSDEPPVPSDWSVYTDLLLELRKLFECTVDIKQQLSQSHRNILMGHVCDPGEFVLEVSDQINSEIRLPDPTYEDTIALSSTIRSIPRPDTNTRRNKNPTTVGADTATTDVKKVRRSSRLHISKEASSVSTTSDAVSQYGGNSLLRRIKKATLLSVI
jgi:hypothetical protein